MHSDEKKNCMQLKMEGKRNHAHKLNKMKVALSKRIKNIFAQKLNKKEKIKKE